VGLSVCDDDPLDDGETVTMWEKIADLFGGSILGSIRGIISDFRLTPEQQLLFEQKAAELEHQVRIKAMEYEISDRKSARDREMAFGGKDKVPMILALGITAGFFGVLFYMLYWGVPDRGGEALFVMLGSLGTAWTAVVSYYFGSSAGSDHKTKIIDQYVQKGQGQMSDRVTKLEDVNTVEAQK
jgi:hypothetical protein